MKLLYLDCFSGISGDMFLGALFDLGVSQKAVERELRKLKLGDWHLHVTSAINKNVTGLRVEVHTGSHARGTSQKHAHVLAHAHAHEPGHSHTHEHLHDHDAEGEHRTFAEIRSIIESAALSPFVKKHAVSIFRRIAEAEGKIHGVKPQKVQFHEVGAIDSIVDIVGGCVVLEELGVDAVQASELRLGSGFVECAH